MRLNLKQKRFEAPLNEFINSVLEKFGKKVVSIILFGSVARGTARKGSDIDLLVVIEDLPEEWRKRDSVLDDAVMSILLKYHMRIFPIIVDPEDVLISAKWPNPLFYGIFLGYEILHDKNRFFRNVMEVARNVIKEKKPIYVEGGKKWELAKLI